MICNKKGQPWWLPLLAWVRVWEGKLLIQHQPPGHLLGAVGEGVVGHSACQTAGLKGGLVYFAYLGLAAEQRAYFLAQQVVDLQRGHGVLLYLKVHLRDRGERIREVLVQLERGLRIHFSYKIIVVPVNLASSLSAVKRGIFRYVEDAAMMASGSFILEDFRKVIAILFISEVTSTMIASAKKFSTCFCSSRVRFV
jgi:hypothetical protein